MSDDDDAPSDHNDKRRRVEADPISSTVEVVDTAIGRLFGMASLEEAVWALLSSASQSPAQATRENMSEMDKVKYYDKLRKTSKAEAEKFAAATGITVIHVNRHEIMSGGSYITSKYMDAPITPKLLAEVAKYWDNTGRPSLKPAHSEMLTAYLDWVGGRSYYLLSLRFTELIYKEGYTRPVDTHTHEWSYWRRYKEWRNG